jgi:hypothetical protein
MLFLLLCFVERKVDNPAPSLAIPSAKTIHAGSIAIPTRTRPVGGKYQCNQMRREIKPLFREVHRRLLRSTG